MSVFPFDLKSMKSQLCLFTLLTVLPAIGLTSTPLPSTPLPSAGRAPPRRRSSRRTSGAMDIDEEEVVEPSPAKKRKTVSFAVADDTQPGTSSASPGAPPSPGAHTFCAPKMAQPSVQNREQKNLIRDLWQAMADGKVGSDNRDWSM